MKPELFYELYDNQEYEKLIKDVEKLFRSSQEYKVWLSTINRDVCAATGLSSRLRTGEQKLAEDGN